MDTGFILVAAGYGSLRHSKTGAPVSKLLETVGGKPLVTYPLIAAAEAGIQHMVIVVNHLSGDAIRATITEKLRKIGKVPYFVQQPDRYGAADAVLRAIPVARGIGMRRALIAYGDMPCWSAETMRMLLDVDASSETVVTMVTALRNFSLPALDRYGRVVRDEHGKIARIIEIDDPRIEDSERMLVSVNPSLWAWELDWLERNVLLVPTFRRPDNRMPEQYMPPLIETAYKQGWPIGEVRLPDARAVEALGVNTMEELELIRGLLNCG